VGLKSARRGLAIAALILGGLTLGYAVLLFLYLG
jgi:hypothetical protein